MRFSDFGKRVVFAAFDGGEITSDAGVLLLREQARRIRLFERMADCFGDRRDPTRTVHTQGKLVHSLGLSWLDRGAAFPRMIGSPVGRFADGGMSGPRWGSGYGLTITCRHIGALRLRSGAGPSAWRFALPVEGGRALRVSGWVVAVYWRSF